eukprot:scaffold3084_cov144-Cylindrotheca_fusiformis.AAC.46
MIRARPPPRLQRMVYHRSLKSRPVNQTMLDFSHSSSWNKKQIEKIEQKFKDPLQKVDSDEELQQMWKEMEGRVTKRRPRTLHDTGGKTGRVNVRKTDEDLWLKEGVYDDQAESDGK